MTSSRFVETCGYEVERVSGPPGIENTSLQDFFFTKNPFLFFQIFVNVFRFFLDFFVFKNTENTKVIKINGDLIKSADRTAQIESTSQRSNGVNRSPSWWADRAVDRRVNRSNGDREGQKIKGVDRVVGRLCEPLVGHGKTSGSPKLKMHRFDAYLKAFFMIFFSDFSFFFLSF